MQLFYKENFASEAVLDEFDSKHCIRVLRKKVGDDFPVFFRIPGEEHVPGGLEKEVSAVNVNLVAGRQLPDSRGRINSGGTASIGNRSPPRESVQRRLEGGKEVRHEVGQMGTETLGVVEVLRQVDVHAGDRSERSAHNPHLHDGRVLILLKGPRIVLIAFRELANGGRQLRLIEDAADDEHIEGSRIDVVDRIGEVRAEVVDDAHLELLGHEM